MYVRDHVRSSEEPALNKVVIRSQGMFHSQVKSMKVKNVTVGVPIITMC